MRCVRMAGGWRVGRSQCDQLRMEHALQLLATQGCHLFHGILLAKLLARQVTEQVARTWQQLTLVARIEKLVVCSRRGARKFAEELSGGFGDKLGARRCELGPYQYGCIRRSRVQPLTHV